MSELLRCERARFTDIRDGLLTVNFALQQAAEEVDHNDTDSFISAVRRLRFPGFSSHTFHHVPQTAWSERATANRGSRLSQRIRAP